MRNQFNLLRYAIQDQIMEYIDEHQFKAHDPLPSERSLCKELGLNRTTFRTAVKELVNEGVLYNVPGKGNFVAPPKVAIELRALNSLSVSIQQQGHSFSRRLLSLEIVEAKKNLADKLKVYLGTQIMALKRLAIVDERPLAIEESYIPTQYCEGLWNYNLEENSLLEILKRDYDLEMNRHNGVILLRRANQHEAEVLQIQPGDPLFVEEGFSYSQNDELIEYSVINGTDHLEYTGRVINRAGEEYYG